MDDSHNNHGFTIVELLVVIVVIGILAAITVVSYGGISKKAVVASLKSDLSNTAKQLKLDQVILDAFSVTLELANNGDGINFSSGTNPDGYNVNNSDNHQTFCLAATKDGVTYNIVQDGQPSVGPCPVLDLDSGISSSYPGTGTDLFDRSGNGNNGVLAKNPSYLNQSLTYEGLNNYVYVPSTASLNAISNRLALSAWIYPTAFDSQWGRIISRDSTPNQNWYIEMNGSNPGKVEYNGGTSNSALALNAWGYVVVVYDSLNVSFYINGVLDRTSSYINMSSSNAWVGIGGKPNGAAGSNFTGRIARATIYNVDLSGTQVSDMYNEQKTRFGL